MQATQSKLYVPHVERGEAVFPPMQPFKQRLLSFLAKASPSNWERVTVNKNVDSVTMPKWVAIAIFGAVLTFGLGQWYRASSEHDTLIEIRTELRLAKEAQAEKDRITNGKLGDLDAWQGVVNGKLSEIKGMLSQQQIDALNRNGVKPERNQ